MYVSFGYSEYRSIKNSCDIRLKGETGKDPIEDFPEYEPCHRILCTNDLLAIENAGGDIDLVTGMRCTIAAFPFRMERSMGHWLRLVAIVEE